MAKRTQEELEALIASHPDTKKEKLDTLVVDTNNVQFDADNTSVNYMSAVTSLACFKLLQALQQQFPEMIPFYSATFKTPLSWKNANNTISSVQLETIAEALEQSMNKIGEIKTGV
jgi:glutathionyl-hydroquinone reductase